MAVGYRAARGEPTAAPTWGVRTATLRMPTTTRTLSEHDSARLVARRGVPMVPSERASDADAAVAAAGNFDGPVVVKLHGDAIAHKTERGLVRLRLTDAAAVRAAATELLAAAMPDDGPVDLVVAPMLSGTRELVAGMLVDPQFGPCVMVGIGGVLTEALGDVAFRLVPLTRADADDMIDELAHQALLGPMRGEPPVDRDALAAVLLALSALAEGEPTVTSVDLNPLVIVDGRPVAVDALVEVTA
jgi:acetate---CoA ligase (ADP-forming) subunit beta